MNRHSAFPLFMILFFFLSCQQEITLDIKVPRQVVAIGSISPGQESEIRISTTTSSSSAPILRPRNAKISLLENGNFIGDYSLVNNQDFVFYQDPVYKLNYDFKEGAKYDISVELKNVETAFSTTVIPDSVQNVSAELGFIELFDENNGFGNYYAEFDLDPLSFKSDDALYHVKVFIGGVSNSFNTPFMQEVPIFMFSDFRTKELLHEFGYLFRGQDIIEGGEKALIAFNFLFNKNTESRGKICLEVRRVSQEYFDFHSTVAEQEVTNVNAGLLTQRTTSISNNIINGVGIFGSYTARRIEFDF